MRLVVVAFAALVALTGAAFPDEAGTREEAVAMVDRVKAMFAEKGGKATFAAVSDPDTPRFHDRDLYPFIYDMDGINVAHGARPVLIGKDLYSIKDQDGKYLIREMIAVARDDGSGWVDYKWPHPITNAIENKSSYISALGDKHFVGVGVHVGELD